MLKKFGLTFLLLVSLGHGLISAEAEPLDIHFGGLYGTSRDRNPTRIVGGSGELYDELKGNFLYWVCLDNEISRDDPWGANIFNVSRTPDILTNGIWGVRGDGNPSLQGDHAASIVQAIANVYYNFESDILGDRSGAATGAGYAFQEVAWALTGGFSYELWSGDLTSETIVAEIEAVIGWFDPLNEKSLFRTYIRSALNGTAAEGFQVYFGNVAYQPGDDPALLEMQAVMLFKAEAIPEPSSILLMLGSAGVIGIFSHRRMRLFKK